MEVSDRKRPREEPEPEPSDAPESQKQQPKLLAPPPYGSQAYWEERYTNMEKEQVKKDQKDTTTTTDENANESKPNAFHAWYFNYEELAPILLPLILGDGAGGDDEEEEEEGDDEEQSNSNETERKEDETTTTTNSRNDQESSGPADSNETKEDTTGEQDDDDDDDEGEEVEISEESEQEEVEITEEEEEGEESSEEEEEDAPERVGLAKNGPISILEVGCGDVPLGRDIAKNVKDLESAAGLDITNIIKKVVCVDYSKTVIEAMQHESLDLKLSVPLVYEVVDARKLPYADESYELLLEKGTLDAMLSDTKCGADNCRLIVSECARVLTIGGYLVIVSHCNAHVKSGLQWLDDIVVPGLRKGGTGQCEWQVEVHGSEADLPSDTEETDGSLTPESPGPAVYVIHKGAPRTSSSITEDKDDPPSNTDDDDSEEETRTIPLRFFTY